LHAKRKIRVILSHAHSNTKEYGNYDYDEDLPKEMV
jgi:hypothetical protein